MMKHKKLISDILFAIIIIILIGIIFYSLFKVREFTEDEINSPELRFWNLMFFTSILIFLIIGSLGFIVDIRKRREEFKKIIEKYSPTQLKVYKITLFLFISANLFFYICIFFIGYILFFNPNLRNDLFLEYFFNIGGIISMWMVIIALVLVCIFLSEEPSQEHREFRAKLKIRKVDHLFIIGFLMIGFVIILQVILLVRSPPVFILFIIETPVGLFFNLLLLLIGGILILIAIVKGMIITLRDYD